MATRQLAAIMFTDIEGYTALMQQDEEEGLRVRNRHREIFNRITEEHGGKILQYYGDGTLSIFKSAIEAVRCGIDLQMAFQEEPVIPVRIGVHQGDILIREDDVIGDGVNVTSRVESLAVAGSVFVSEAIDQELRNQPSIETKSMGRFDFKNVEQRMEVFAVTNPGLVVPSGKLSGKTAPRGQSRSTRRLVAVVAVLALALIAMGIRSWVLPRTGEGVIGAIGKSIAVLPFENISGDASQEYFSDGITEDIIAHLSKVADLRVISRTSTKQYKNTLKTIPEIGEELGVSAILEGSVRKQGEQIRITAQLINAKTDEHVWTEIYDRKLQKIFDVQTEVAKDIVKVMKATLTPKEEETIAKAATSEITAYDYYLRGKEALEVGETRRDDEHAAQFFREAIKTDPRFAAAYVGLAWTVYSTRYYGSTSDIWHDSVLSLNAQALRIDPDLDEALFQRSIFHLIDGDSAAAKRGFQRVLEINPNHGASLGNLGGLILDEGEIEKGVEMVAEGYYLELNRKDPRFYLAWGSLYIEVGEPQQAKPFLEQAIRLNPESYSATNLLVEIALDDADYSKALTYAEKLVAIEKNTFALDRLAWAQLHNGNLEEAEAAWRELGQLVAEFDDPYFATPYKHRLGYVLWQQGREDEGRNLMEEQARESLDRLDRDVVTSVRGEYYDLAAVHAFLGRKEEAFRWLYSAADSGFFAIGLIERDPLLDPIREDDRFEELLARKKSEVGEDAPVHKEVRKRLRELEDRGMLQI